ncbi:hypothetical protein FGG08_001550 [Glutinoglossum americanum]|uniref:Uncharacterized protein n=1 Tax=Glutinoglossum americanum TaxID=1670608 RepID=A0A9P8L663_9PEZI|nr:hypothetical protein FGG08_001550 [Glutinoglossum americanum]
MLSHLSSKFQNAPNEGFHEPRAALILNRFTRTLTILYATTALSSIIGLPPEAITGKSFYECIQENCLQDAIQCLERAKANDSIAYMRFWYRDPRQGNQQDEDIPEQSSSGDDDDDDGGVCLGTRMDETQEQFVSSDSSLNPGSSSTNARSLSDNSTDFDDSTNTSPIFGHTSTAQSSSSSTSKQQRSRQGFGRRPQAPQPRPQPLEVEAVVSCTSDGLVVILRRARPIIPQACTAPQTYTQGLFATPWAVQPLMPAQLPPQPVVYDSGIAPGAGQVYAQSGPLSASGPDLGSLMDSIRQVAVFAWSLTGINGSLVQYARGKAAGQSQPPDGLPVWNPSCGSNGGIANNPAEARYGNGPSGPFWAGSHGFGFSDNTSHGLWPHHLEERQLSANQSQGAGNESSNRLWSGRRGATEEDRGWDWRGPDPDHPEETGGRRHLWY